MDRYRDEEQEDMLRDIIAGGDDITSHFLNDSGEGVGEKMMAPVREWRENMTALVLEP